MQIRLTIESNTGGSGKTTLATHLAYVLGSKGFRVVLIELDPNGSIALFTGLPKLKADQVQDSIAAIFEKQFKGNYPAIPVWTDHINSVQVIRGGTPLHTSIRGLHQHDRPYEVLKHRLEDHPLDADVIIIDTPASIEPMGLVGLAACSHFLAAIKPEFKDSWGASDMLDWFYEKVDSLRLRPYPEILGFVPSRVDFDLAVHRNLLGVNSDGSKNEKIDPVHTIPYQLNQLEITCFPPIRESGYFLSASGAGIPVHIYRTGDKVTKSFDPIVEKIVKVLKQK